MIAWHRMASHGIGSLMFYFVVHPGCLAVCSGTPAAYTPPALLLYSICWRCRLLSFVGPWPEEHKCAISQNMESFNLALWAKIGRYSPRCSTHLQRGSQTLKTAKRSEPQGRRHFWWGSQTEPSTSVNSNDEWRMKIRKAWEIKETLLQVWQVW